MKVTADPYDFPIGGMLEPSRTALVIIDMQRDFCDAQGYMGARGDDVSPARAIVPRIMSVREAARGSGMPIFYTREGHKADLSDLPRSKRLKTARAGAEIGSRGPLGRLLVRGEPGWEIIPELSPSPDEIVIDKPGTGAFHATELHPNLVERHVTSLVLVGVTTGVCVSSTAREAADRGFDVLVLADCCAEPDSANHQAAVHLLKIEDGYLATVSMSEDFLRAVTTI